MECRICENERMPHSIYCRVCGNLVLHQREGRARAAALIKARRKDGFHCEYSDVLMDLKNPSSPYYVNFEHRVPGVSGDIAACIAVVNVSKANMTWDEFPLVVHELIHHWETGAAFNRDIVPFRCWRKAAQAQVKAGLWRPGDMPLRRIPPLEVQRIGGSMVALDGLGLRAAAEIVRALGAPARSCKICRKPVGPKRMFCPRCLRLVHRASPTSKLLQAQALIDAFDGEHDGFRCYYCGALLELEDWTSPWYLWYDHVIPRTEGNVVASSAVMNRMKTDTSEEEFHAYMKELDRAMTGGIFDTSKVRFEHWKRHGN